MSSAFRNSVNASTVRVDVLSISVGDPWIVPFHENSFDIGTLYATKHDIFISVTVGNKGSKLESLEDHAPWMLTVNGRSTDRITRVKIRQGNGEVID